MPTYTYECKKCGHLMDVFHSMSDGPRVKCESCGSRSMKRKVGTGAGIIFKGSGFYETDYKEKKGEKPKEKAAAKSDKSDKTDKKAESKSEKTKSESESKSDSGKKPKSTEAA
jgi:putative FmdB family regulatory protein